MNYNIDYAQKPLRQEMVNMPPYWEIYSCMCTNEYMCSTCFRSRSVGWQWQWYLGAEGGYERQSISNNFPRQYPHWTWDMKRGRDGMDKEGSNPHSGSKKTFWASGLLAAMKDPKCVLKEDDAVVVIADKYPKAEFHFLVLPKEDISNISKLNQEHLPLLQHMEDIGREISSKHPDHTFLFGYHALASMIRLHLHVVSDDFNSQALKTKKHWNSFTTPFFISSQELIKSIEKNGKMQQMSHSHAKELLDTPLKCHKCSMKPQNIPKLKQHLIIHQLKKKHAAEDK